MQGFAQRVALVTGASSGIGRALAIRLASLGADLALLARTESRLKETAAEIERLGRRALVLPGDVTDSEQCRSAIERSVKQLGKLDILVCSAGVSMRSRFEETSLDAMEKVMRINFFGTLYPTWHAIPYVKKTRGSLIAVSSLVGKRGSPTYAVYSASKFAVQGLYESLRLELAPEGIHVGIVSPGHVETPLRERVLGPTGEPWKTPPPVPFRIWPVSLVVDQVVRILEKRKAEALLPGFVGPMLALDQLLGPWLGDRIVSRQFRRHPLP